MQLFRTITRSLGILAVLSAAVLLGNAGPAAASNGSSQLLCFDGAWRSLLWHMGVLLLHRRGLLRNTDDSTIEGPPALAFLQGL